MEELMYFVWQQRLCMHLSMPDGQALDILHPGLRNLDAGPDFFNAKIKVGDVVWAGNVEMHVRASDWYRHHHDTDPAYDSVILHVVMDADQQVHLRDGRPLRTVCMTIPDDVMQRYRRLVTPSAQQSLLPGQIPSYSAITCAPQLPRVPSLVLHDWLTALCTQRMMDKVQRVASLVEDRMQGWNEAFYIVLTRSLGTGVNSDTMERLARSLPYSCLLHHRDNLAQLQALLLGQAGLLQPMGAAQSPAAPSADWALLQREYAFLRQKFSLTPLAPSAWKLGRIRPAAHPQERLKALAMLIHTRRDLKSQVLEAADLDAMERVLTVAGLGLQTRRSLIINAVVPMLLAYARWQGDEERIERALALLEQLPPEANRHIAQWTEAGIAVRSAFDTQALLQLTLQYCQPHKCLRCRIGCYLLKRD